MLRVGICDDEEQFTIQLKEHLLQYAENKNISIKVYTFLNEKELFDGMNEKGIFDLLFLDIVFENTSGVEIGKKIRADLKNEMMQIVFVSTKQDYAMQLFDIRPMNFLIKPIDEQKVLHIIDEYSRLFGMQNRFFCYHIGKKEYKMNEQRILYFQSQGKKIKMTTLDGEEYFYGKLSEIVALVNERNFLGVHKSFVINMQHVAQYSYDSILMIDGERIPVSQAMRKKLREKILDNIV